MECRIDLFVPYSLFLVIILFTSDMSMGCAVIIYVVVILCHLQQVLAATSCNGVSWLYVGLPSWYCRPCSFLPSILLFLVCGQVILFMCRPLTAMLCSYCCHHLLMFIPSPTPIHGVMVVAFNIPSWPLFLCTDVLCRLLVVICCLGPLHGLWIIPGKLPGLYSECHCTYPLLDGGGTCVWSP